jgi:EPS-associated MarR family transcriptional regulator
VPQAYPKLREDNAFRVLHFLENYPQTTQRVLAKEVGLSLGSIHYCIRALTEKGLLKIENFQKSKNKVAYTYILTPKGIAERAYLTSRFLKRKIAEYDRLRAEIKALQATGTDLIPPLTWKQ